MADRASEPTHPCPTLYRRGLQGYRMGQTAFLQESTQSHPQPSPAASAIGEEMPAYRPIAPLWDAAQPLKGA